MFGRRRVVSNTLRAGRSLVHAAAQHAPRRTITTLHARVASSSSSSSASALAATASLQTQSSSSAFGPLAHVPPTARGAIVTRAFSSTGNKGDEQEQGGNEDVGRDMLPVWNQRLYEQLKQRKWRNVLNLWKQMQESDSETMPSLATMQAVVTALGHSGRFDDAFAYLDRILAGMQGDDATASGLPPLHLQTSPGDPKGISMLYTNLIRAAGNRRRVRRAVQARDALRALGPIKDRDVYTELLIAFGSEPRYVSEAFATLEEMEAVGIRPSLEVYGALLNATLSSRDTAKVQQALQLMESKDMLPTGQMYSRALSLALDRLDADLGLHASNALSGFGTVLDEGTILRMITSAAQVASVPWAEAGWQAYMNAQIAPGHVAANALVHTYACAGEVEKAFRALHYMAENALPANDGTLKRLAVACGQSRNNADASYFTLVQLRDEAPSLVTTAAVNAVIRACAQLGDFDRAFGTFGDMQQLFEVREDVATYNALLLACVRTKQIDAALKVQQEMLEHGISPNWETVHLGVEAHVVCGKAEEGLLFWRQALADGSVAPRPETRELLIRKFARIGKFDDADALVQEQADSVSQDTLGFVERCRERRHKMEERRSLQAA